jgi:hypothetical protein
VAPLPLHREALNNRWSREQQAGRSGPQWQRTPVDKFVDADRQHDKSRASLPERLLRSGALGVCPGSSWTVEVEAVPHFGSELSVGATADVPG